MRFYQLGGGQLGMVEEPQSQVPSPQMQQAPQQMQQQVSPQDQTMQMFQMYFDKMQMSQEEIEQFMQEFQAIQPQEQQKVLEYIGQSLQEPQQQVQQPQMQQKMSQEQPMMQAGGRYKRMYQVAGEFVPMDSSLAGLPNDDSRLTPQSFVSQEDNSEKYPMVFSDEYRQANPQNIEIQNIQPVAKSNSTIYTFNKSSGNYVSVDGKILPAESIAGSTGHYDFKGNSFNTSVGSTKKVSVKEGNDLVRTPDADLTEAKRLKRNRYAEEVRDLQKAIEEQTDVKTDKNDKGKIYDGVFGSRTAEGLKKLYAKNNDGKEGTNAEIIKYANSNFKGVTLPSQYFNSLELHYNIENGASDESIAFAKKQKEDVPVNPATDDNGFTFVKKADDGVGQILKDKTGSLIYKSVTGEFWDSNAKKLDIQGDSKAIPITDVGKVAAIAEARKDSIIIKDKSGLFDLSGYGKKEIVALNDIPKLVGDQNYYNQVNTTLKSVSNGYMGANNIYQSARNPDQYSNQFIDIGGGLAFDPSTNLFLERSVSGSYHKPSSTKIESYLNTPKGEIFKQDYKAGTLVKKNNPVVNTPVKQVTVENTSNIKAKDIIPTKISNQEWANKNNYNFDAQTNKVSTKRDSDTYQLVGEHKLGAKYYYDIKTGRVMTPTVTGKWKQETNADIINALYSNIKKFK